MYAIRQHAFGTPDMLVYEEVEPLTPGPGEVRLAVTAAGVHLMDTVLRAQLRPILARVYQSDLTDRQRGSLLRLLAETYARQMKLHRSLDQLRVRLRRRLNEIYADQLGIQPPGF